MRGTAGIPWYAEEDYPKLLLRFEDAGKLPRTFDDWVAGAEKTEESYRLRGYQVSRVPLEPASFSTWCRRGGLRLNAKARKRFAAVMAGRMAKADERECGNRALQRPAEKRL